MDYDFRYGEDDLSEATVYERGRLLSLASGAILLVVCGILATALLLQRTGQEATAVIPATSAATRSRPLCPQLRLESLPPLSPQAPQKRLCPSITPTPRPCIRRVSAGDSLISIVSGCGHRNLDILPTVVAINGIVDETRILIGQEIVVPWPSPTSDPLATLAPTIEAAALSDDDASADEFALLSFDPFAPTPTATLLPGLMWHRVAAGENMIVIAVQYHTNAKVLSDLNPEIEFALCEFGEVYGGPECIVELSVGQAMRVPAPTPTLTPWPTPSGSETPTPSRARQKTRRTSSARQIRPSSGRKIRSPCVGSLPARLPRTKFSASPSRTSPPARPTLRIRAICSSSSRRSGKRRMISGTRICGR